MIKGHHSIC